jgi:hypothetical protein
LPRLTKTPTPTHTPAAAHAGQAPLRSQQETRTSGGACGTSPTAQPAGDQNQRRCLRDQPQHSQQETRTSGGACGTGPSTASRYRRGYRGTLGPISGGHERNSAAVEPTTAAGRRRGGLAPTACTTKKSATVDKLGFHDRGLQAWGVGSHGLHNKPAATAADLANGAGSPVAADK